MDFLQAKSEADESAGGTGGAEGGKTDDSKTVSTVQIDPSKLIDAVNHPLRRLTSDLTLTVTRSVTDALVGTGELCRFIIRGDPSSLLLVTVMAAWLLGYLRKK